ncbi:MAG: hypothetical protein ABIL58_27220 [Pseudomonadota bacterium]
MESDRITVGDLERRWEKALSATQTAVRRQPEAYHRLKALTGEIVSGPLDIRDYLPTVRKMISLLRALDPHGGESIFHYFENRISPADVWQVNLFRMECTDLLAHLKAFDDWRIKNRRLKIVK